jgi:BirA family biotin operon repressor/biotin-[acetyl-CoA-carboxylase] ligase
MISRDFRSSPPFAPSSVGRVTSPRPIDAAAVHAALDDRWTRVSVVGTTASTNADLLADPGAPDRTALVAEVQTAGRGRLDRTWTSPPGHGLTFSVLLRPKAPMLLWGWLPLLAGVALHEAVTAATGIPVELKWPNDLIAREEVGGGKLGGILAQTSADAVVIGIGLNVTTPATELPVDGASSLVLCGATDVGRDDLLVGILSRIDARVAQWSDVGGDAEACGLAAAYRDLCATLGLDVAITTGQSVVRGRAVAIDDSGRLVIDVDGVQRAMSAGDVEHVRAA